jgi:hypothetical protein
VIRKALLAALVVVSLTGGGIAAADTQQSSLSAFVCQQASNPLNRVVGVTATMSPVAGTQRMVMRFQLLERLPGQWFHQVHGGDLGHWLHPNPSTLLQPWAVKKPVVNLDAPATYRFRVTFRWIGSAGVIASTTRLSQRCYQRPTAG